MSILLKFDVCSKQFPGFAITEISSFAAVQIGLCGIVSEYVAITQFLDIQYHFLVLFSEYWHIHGITHLTMMHCTCTVKPR